MRRMVAGIKHRGPDDDGFKILSTLHTDDGITAIANTRLAILDLSPAGHQPMFDPGTGNWIVFNGEIYNHLEIRAEIGGRVRQWHSTSDTETILQAYHLWGRDCVQRLRGMFAFAIWDAAGGKLWCVRDRLGIKPFYYCAQPDALLFASEVRSLLAYLAGPAQVPVLALQVLVENAIKHGVAPLEQGGEVRIGAERKDGALHLWVEDPGPGLSNHRGTGTALDTLRQRLKRPGDLEMGMVDGVHRVGFRWRQA